MRPGPDPQGSLTADYLSGRRTIPIPSRRRKPKRILRLLGVRHNNLNEIDVEIPLGILLRDRRLRFGEELAGARRSYRNLVGNLAGFSGTTFAPDDQKVAGACRSLRGDEEIGEVIMVGESRLARSPRSTPAVYVGAYDADPRTFRHLAGGARGRAFAFLVLVQRRRRPLRTL